jgi:ABC-type uncharacterized transport system substrate-binding protein
MKEKTIPLGSFLVISLLAVVLSLVWACQQTEIKKKDYLIGIINPNKGTQDINKGFIQKLKENGFTEGKNTTFLRYDNNFEMDEVIHDMAARNADLIFTVTTPATRKAKKATLENKIPVIYVMQDPVGSKVLPSLAQHDFNLTGVQIRGSVPKALEWMLAVSPGLKHLFVPVKYDTKAAKQSLEDLEKTANSLGIKITLVEVNDQSELDTALAAIAEDVDGIFILCSIFIHSNIKKLVQAAIDNKLLIGSGAAQSDLGVTISYGMIAEKTGAQAGRLANLVLKGQDPAEIPSEIAEYYIGVNLKTAEETGVEIPVDILQQADIISR